MISSLKSTNLLWAPKGQPETQSQEYGRQALDINIREFSCTEFDLVLFEYILDITTQEAAEWDNGGIVLQLPNLLYLHLYIFA